LAKLSRLNVAGGNIRNIALNAAFLAAAANEPVGMTHLLQAANTPGSNSRSSNQKSETGPEQIAIFESAIKLAEGVGFEPTVGLTPRSISSRVP
jgi:hypothetical protein